MVRIRSTNELIQDGIDFFRSSQPSLDTKPGTVARDLLIEAPASQLSRLYEEISSVKSAQSLRLSLGADLDKWASNFGLSRKQGSKSSGTAIATFSSIEADITINKGDVVGANNGATFTALNTTTVSSANANRYRAIASKYRAALDFASITDEYATELTVEATAAGTIGNISSYSLSTITTSGVTNITNSQPFSGGSQAENDAAFKLRVLSVFSGANTGTELGYKNATLSDRAAQDAIVVGPGDDLMTRDGTQVSEAEDGTRTIIADGTGGKVDIYVLGTRLTEILDSYIYRDLSNENDPTDPDNHFTLGQIDGQENKTVTRKRLENLRNNELPAQPVNDIIEISGSSSGSNFIQKQTDSLGRITGNFELLKDTGTYAGSPWGFDKLHWIDNQISNHPQDISKGRFNGQDPTTFAGVLAINKITQNIQIINENSRVSPANRTSIQLSHYPISTVSRVFNLTTGERYVIASQNPDGGSINTTGRITISGNTLPAVSDTLQVDYTWIYEYDPYIDFDNRFASNNPRDVVDSVDWGYSNAVRREESTVSGTSSFSVSVTHPISTVISINTFEQETTAIVLVQGRYAVVTSQEITGVTSVISSGLAELYRTSKNDGSFSGFTVFLPTDTTAVTGEIVTITYNAENVYSVDGVNGSFESTNVTLPTSATVTAGTVVECNYIANVKTILPTTTIASLPAVKNANTFNTIASTGVGTQPCSNVYSGDDIIQNLRIAPSRLQLTVSGQISQGTFTIRGTTITRIQNAIVPVSTAGLTHNLSSAIKTALNLKSTDSVPSNVYIAKLARVEKITALGNEILTNDHTYDITGYKLYNNSFSKSESILGSLTNTEIELPATPDNEDNAPAIGEKLLVTFHIATTDDSENVSFSKAGSLYTNKSFGLIDTVSVSSGFTSAASQAASLTISNQNQPVSGTRYSVYYDYLAPKPNERITIRYNQNRLIGDSTLAIEGIRPISADVLVKAAIPILIDANINIVVSQEFTTSSTIVRQNVLDSIVTAINSNRLGSVLDSSDLIQSAYTVSGVDRVRIMYFNITGNTGSLLSVEAGKNEYLKANTVTVTVESR